MSNPDDLAATWSDVQSRLPGGWQLDGLRCASTGLAADQRSDEWVAVAVGPGGEERSFRAAEPGEALRGLEAIFEPPPDASSR